MSAFRSFLLNILSPDWFGHGEKFLHLLKDTGDNRLCFEGCELASKVICLALERQDALFDHGNVMLSQSPTAGLGRHIQVEAAEKRFEQDRIEFLRRFGGHEKFLSFLALVLSVGPQEAEQ